MPIQFKAVSAETKRLIDIGNRVIRECRALVAMGASNQLQDVLRTRGRSNLLAKAAVFYLNRRYIWDRPLKSGAVTVAFGAGNCQLQASVAYTILRSELTAVEKVCWCINSGINHAYTTIGDPATNGDDKVICVDPWPIKPQALLLQDHFCRLGTRVVRGKPGGRIPTTALA
jgi:hypothetical protein